MSDLKLSPPPSESKPYILSSSMRPAYPSVDRDWGSVTGSAAATTYTDPNAESNWVGCLVRINTDQSNNQESLLQGEYDYQAKITAVSGTTVTVDVALPVTYQNATSLVSSIVDIDQEAMQTYLLDLTWVHYCRNHKHDSLEQAIQLAKMSLQEAKRSDNKVNRSDVMTLHNPMGRITDMDYAEVVR